MSADRIVVGLAGPAGSGKSTCAAHLEGAHDFTRVRFADPLKNMLRALFRSAGLGAEEIERRIEGDLKEAPDDLLCGKTPRQAMQTLGTEWGRILIGEGLWTGIWSAQAARFARVVAEDTRFANEVAAVRAAGGKVVAISCPWASSTSGAGHASEAGISDPDARISNDVEGDEWGMLYELAEVLSSPPVPLNVGP